MENPKTYSILRYFSNGRPMLHHKGDVFFNAFVDGALVRYKTYGRALNKAKKVSHRRENTGIEVCAVKVGELIRDGKPVAVFCNGADITTEYLTPITAENF